MRHTKSTHAGAPLRRPGLYKQITVIRLINALLELSLYERRCYRLSGCERKHVPFFESGTHIRLQSFTMNYVQDFFRRSPSSVVVICRWNDRSVVDSPPPPFIRQAKTIDTPRLATGDLRNAASSRPLGVYVGVCKRCRECSGSSRG